MVSTRATPCSEMLKSVMMLVPLFRRARALDSRYVEWGSGWRRTTLRSWATPPETQASGWLGLDAITPRKAGKKRGIVTPAPRRETAAGASGRVRGEP